MNATHKRFLNTLMTCLTVFSLVLNLALPAASLLNTARAQESTAEPLLPTPEATPTDVPAQPPVEATADATEPPAAPTAEVTSETAATETATALPTQPATSFADDFQDGNTDGWLLTPGWMLVSDNGNLFLTTAEAEQTAAIADFSLADFTLSARLRLETGRTASVIFHAGVESYTVSLDSDGNVALYRSAALLAQGTITPPLPEGTPALWHTLNLQIFGGLIVVTVNGTPQIVYTDTVPLPAGNIIFSAPSGGLSLDEVNISALTTAIQPPVIPTVPAPTATPEVTAEAATTPETTSEPEMTPETTPESEVTPEATLEPEITPEVTAEPAERLVLSADFEGDLTGWTPGENTSVVLDGETNHALLMPAGSNLHPAAVLSLSDFRLETRVNLTEAVEGAPSGVNLSFRAGDGSGYVLSVEAGQTALYRNDQTGDNPLASFPTSRALNTWHTLELSVQGGRILVTVDNTPELDYTDAAPLTGGQIAFTANAASLLDDIAVYVPAALLENVTPTPAGMALSDEEKTKLSGAIPAVLDLWLSGQEDAALELAKAYYLPFDDQNNLRVVVWAADGVTGEALTPAITAVGGAVDVLNTDNIEARVPLNGLVALINTPQVRLITPVSTAVSTGVTASVPLATTGALTAEGYDILGVKSWHDAGVRGANQTIAAIDTGFNGLANLSADERACVSGTIPAGGSAHGIEIVKILCDIAPDALVKLYKAQTATELATAINAARTAGANVILITLDLGADASPGDGVSGGQMASVYTAITSARSDGRLVVVSAGNSYGRYASFQYNNAPGTTVTIKATGSDVVRVRWNGTGTITASLVGPAPVGTIPFTANGSTGGYFTVPNLGAAANPGQVCYNNYPTVDDPDTPEIEAVRNYCDLTLTFTGSGSGYIQVQAQTSVTIPADYDGAVPLFPGRTAIDASSVPGANVTSSIGRPADSADALTVGAVCAEPSLGLPIQTTSSRGPVFSSGGGAPANPSSATDRTKFKPNLVGVSDLGTDFNDGSGNKICDSDDDYGFAGTSGAAAHVAGIAALIRSNTNLNITTRDGIIDYMQSHSADMFASPATKPDGFDMATGAGLAVLGNPAPDYPLSVNLAALTRPTTPDMVFCPSGHASFVYPNNLNADISAANYGSFDNPYVHVGQALAASASSADCVILLPGEYVTPLNVKSGQVPNGVQMRSYDTAVNQTRAIDQTTTPDSVFWETVNGFGDSGGIYVAINNFTIEGFLFRGAAHAQSRISDVVGIDVSGSSGSVIRNNIFTRFTGGQPIRVDPAGTTGSQNVLIERNTFRDNNGSRGAAIAIYNSSGSTTAITIQFNNFTENRSTVPGWNLSSPVIFIQNGAANIYNNRFVRNRTNGLVRVQNANDAYEVSLFGNAFIDNSNSGPVIHLVPGRRFRFINNTVGGSVSMEPTAYGSIIVRGDATGAANTNGLWEIHNNLFYNNSAVSLIKDFEFVSCSSITSGYNSEDGAKNNWAWRSGTTSGVCQNSLIEAQKNRVETTTALPWFTLIGAAKVPNNPYQLVKAAVDNSPDDGIDDGDTALATGTGGALYSDRDVLRRNRIEGDKIDIGAYEYRAISAGNPEPVFTEDTTDFAFPLEAEGGFPTYKFSIANYPTLYDTDPTNPCGGQPVVLEVSPTSEETWARYCPPKNLYTDGAPAQSQVSFTFNVQDLAGNKAKTPGTVIIHITQTNDQPLATSIDQKVTVEEAPAPDPTIIQFRLRPFVSFDDNFIYSEDGGEEDVLGANGTPMRTNTPGADYPYTYAYVSGSLNVSSASGLDITPEKIIAAIEAANTNKNSLVTLSATGGEKGLFWFEYTVNESAATNKVTVEVVPTVAYTGLHDDTSFSFDYDNNWTPLYSEGNINNTLHQSKTLNAEATFKFVGTGFALYMQGATTGGFWELQVDGTSFNWEGNKTVTRGNITCRTTAATGKTTPTTPNNGKYISNKQATAYTVACTRLRQDEAHVVKIINRTRLAPLNIDAIGVLATNSVLLPGFHEVRETQMTPLFFGWEEFTAARGPSNGIAMSTSDANVAPITFTFKGTGFAIGTALEQTRSKEGAAYTICFAPASTGVSADCSEETKYQFNNATGATTVPTWNTFRPFFGFDPNIEYEVMIDINSIPAGGRMVIDSIVIFDRKPANILPMGTTEDTNRNDIIYGGGLEDTWVLDTNNTRASANSLTSIATTVTKAGPFISFQIPDAASSFIWWRSATPTDSTSIMICVDRAQLDTSDTQTTFCITKPLRTTTAPIVTNNPLVVNETDFAGGWGRPWNGAHTVEIFSLTNQPFNLDKLQVLSSEAPLLPSSYEQTVPNLCYFDDDQAGFPCNDGTAPESSVITVNNARASGGSVAFIKERSEGVFFRFTGTSFSTLFTMDNRGGSIQICWRRNSEVTEATKVADTLAGTCQQFNNYSAAATYQAARTIAGLENTTYAAVIQHTGAADWVSTTSGNSMQVDAVVIYGDRWQDLNELTPLADGGRYETSYANQAANRQFNYLGGGWKSVTGTAARSYSGQNYDQVKAYGAGIVFRTNGADTVRLYRDLRSGYAPLRVCYAPYTAGTFVVNYGLMNCTDIRSDGGTAYQSAFNVNMGSAGPHVVSITTLNAGVLNLDAIELLNSTPALTAGVYPETDPRLIYGYGAIDPDTIDINAKWRNLTSTLYLDKAAMQSTASGASVTFSFTGTGFSLFTLADSTSSSVQITISGANSYPAFTRAGNSTSTFYGHAHSVTGLPNGTYTVTITENDASRNKFTVDGIEIYGNYSAAVGTGIYDDTALNPDGSLVFNYGPSNTAWTVNLGSRALSNLNQSNHTANRQGATLSFAVTGANAITLHHIGSTSTKVAFCVTTAAGAARNCEERTLVGNNNSTFDSATLFPNNVGSYQVSITNLTPGTNLIVDAISVLNTTGNTMQPGIYQENSSLLTYGGNWASGFLTEAAATDKRVKSTTVGTPNQTLTFTFNGTGFSIVLVESTTTSHDYTLAVTGVNPPTALTNAAGSAARAPSALTYVGFTPGPYTVTLTNNDSKPLLVDRVDILGNVNDIPTDVTGGVENSDARIVYFPYFSFTETAAAAASGGSQHLGSMRGAVAYFELNNSAFEYVRETKTAYGQVTTCSNALGIDSLTSCTLTTIPNNVAPFGFQQSQNVTAISGGWAIIRNADGKPMPLDFVRPVNTTGVLTAGYYEDTLAATYNYFNFDASFAETSNTSASGGTVQTTTTQNGAALFRFNGTGFSVYFALDKMADTVDICWTQTVTLDPLLVERGDAGVTCQGQTTPSFDNTSTATRYKAARTILGLADGDYTAVVRHTGATGTTSMQVDAIQIYDDTLPTRRLETIGTRYETSYANRNADNMYLYYGQGWRSVTGAAAARYSGTNYDTIANVIGAGVVFRTFNADAIVVYRSVGAASAPMQICSQRSGVSNRSCVTVDNKTGTGVQPVSIQFADAGQTGERIISITTTDAGTFSLDAIEIGSSMAPLGPGFYEEVHPGLKFTNGVWSSISGTIYSGGQARWTSDAEARLEFSFEGATGFAIGTVLDTLGGSVEVCYDTDTNWGTDDKCYTYQNKSTRTNATTSRAVTGLDAGTRYYVRVRNAQAARLIVDYVNIFGEALPPAITASGQYNENAADSGGNPYLQLLPANRWNSFTGTAAKGFSGSSYAGVADNNKRISSAYAGPAATLRLTIPANDSATVVLYTGTASSLNAAEVLVCANDIAADSCISVTNLKTVNQIVLNKNDLPALSNPGGTPVTITLSFRALLPGYFRVDGFQVVYGTTLAPGIYDNFLAGSGGVLNTGAATWPTVKAARAYGGTMIRTQTPNATLTFDFSGTGFSVLTQADRLGADFRLCYALKAGFDGTFDGLVNGVSGTEAINEICQAATTSTLTTGAATWVSSNGSRPNPNTANQYGFAVHGLPPAVYTVEVRHTDTTPVPATGLRTDWLQIDAVVIYGAPGALLTAGQIYDDTNANIIYSPADFWTLVSARSGPSRGPWNRTEHNTTAVGAIAQFQVQGNALVLYQTASARGSRNVRICLTTSDGQECSEFNQSAKTTYFTPIAFYGFGKAATHNFVIENWDYGKILSMDALQVLP